MNLIINYVQCAFYFVCTMFDKFSDYILLPQNNYLKVNLPTWKVTTTYSIDPCISARSSYPIEITLKRNNYKFLVHVHVTCMKSFWIKCHHQFIDYAHNVRKLIDQTDLSLDYFLFSFFSDSSVTKYFISASSNTWEIVTFENGLCLQMMVYFYILVFMEQQILFFKRGKTNLKETITSLNHGIFYESCR